jgi:probable rRNA maturation factor
MRMKPLPYAVSAMADGGPSRKRPASPGVTLEVEIVRHEEAWAPAQPADAMLERAALAAFLAAPPLRPGVYQVALALTGDAEMRTLNRTWRGKDAATNVLSFPAGDDLREPGLLGDVVLAYETTLKEAREQSIALQDHVAHLVVHGVLHLLGFDHATDEDAERMENLERTALASLDIADPYAEAEGAGAEEVSS